jgi:hypothetical protein
MVVIGLVESMWNKLPLKRERGERSAGGEGKEI